VKSVTKEGSFYQWYRLLLKYHTQKLKLKANRQQLVLLKQFLGNDSVFFDVGANKGLFTYWACRYIQKNGSIHIFEPQSELFWIFKNLENKFPLNKFFLNNCGLSDENSFARLHRNCIGDGSASLNTINDDYSAESSIKLYTLDEYCQSNQISKIDFIKIDVEGHEQKTIRGGINTIEKLRPTLLIEMNPEIGSKEVINRFMDLGYKVKMIFAGQIFDSNSTFFQSFMNPQDTKCFHADFIFYF
jgi:FkbM family methyltransferase